MENSLVLIEPSSVNIVYLVNLIKTYNIHANVNYYISLL